MDINSPIFKLQVITFTSAICSGLTYASIVPQLLKLGGGQFVIGIMASGSLLCSLLSSDIIGGIAQNYGKRYALYVTFNTAIVSHLLAVLTDNYWFTIFAHYIFSITNQSQNLCKDLLLQNAENPEIVSKNFRIISGAGLIIGPFICGCIFDYGFLYVGLLAATLLFVNSYLVMNVSVKTEKKPEKPDERTLVQKNQDKLLEVIENLKKCDYEKNLDLIVVRYLYSLSVITFSTRFPPILMHNFNASSFVIGYTGSFITIVNFAGPHLVNNMKNKYLSNFSVLETIEWGLIVTGISVSLAYFSPLYLFYTVMCTPSFISFILVNSQWKDLFSTRNEYLNKINSAVGTVAGLTVHLIFACVEKIVGYHTIIVFLIIPLLISHYILKKYTHISIDESKRKEE